MSFLQNPKIIYFYLFFLILTDEFRASILCVCVGVGGGWGRGWGEAGRYLASATSTVLGQSWIFTIVFFIVWGYACVFCCCCCFLCVCFFFCVCVFFFFFVFFFLFVFFYRIRKIRKLFFLFFLIFNLDVFCASILWKWIGTRFLVSPTLPTVFGRSFWNFTDV